ncbi:MAG: glycosyltransferase family 4 protein [Bacteroidales bacterium]|nr:glycosyltransferase family 4 protein [Bacteroidales bacterium]
MSRKSIWLVHPGLSTFVQADIDMLKAHFHVSTYHYVASKNPLRFAFELISLKVVALLTLWRHEVVYIWFADYHAVIPAIFGRLFRKKVIVAVGGFDAVAIPDIKYGVFFKDNFRAWCALKTYQMAHLILPVDQSLIKGHNVYADPSGKGYPVGIKHFVPKLKARIEVLPTGYDTSVWQRNTDIEQKPSVLTIAGAAKMQTFILKGLDLLIETARLLPETSFTIVGLHHEMSVYASGIIPENVVLAGYIPNAKLPDVLSAHKVFVQFSLSEGLPNTLCEAMLCECIPVGSNVNGIPRCIGSNGFILQSKNAAQAAALITKALATDKEAGLRARDHIARNFSKKQRAEKLLRLISQLTSMS